MKTLPQAIELEESILGAILIESKAYNQVSGIIKASDFYKEQNQIIFQNIEEMNHKGINIDILTLSEYLNKNKKLKQIGGAYYIAGLTNNIASSANIEHHCRMVVEKSMLRKLITKSHDVINRSFENDDVFDLISDTQKMLDDVSQNVENRKTEIAYKILQDLEKERRETKGKGLELGFERLDKITNTLKKGNLVILGARPGMGKTSLGLQLAYQVAHEQKPVIFFSLEMTKEEVIARVQSQLSGVSKNKIDRNEVDRFEQEMVSDANKQINKMPLYVDDNAGAMVRQMKMKAQQIKALNGLSLIVVDYLQLAVGTNANNREQEISQISRGLKEMAKDLECPVIALSQLSRAVETRGDKRPKLSDLRDSGAIEQDADMVWFMYRPKYYDDNLEEDIVELNISKNRGGSLGTINFEFKAFCTNFTETDKEVTDPEYNNPFVDKKPF